MVCSVRHPSHRAIDQDWQSCKDFVSYYFGSQIIDCLLIIDNHVPCFYVHYVLQVHIYKVCILKTENVESI